ncbi:MAG: DUF3303 domain-containing protein [Acidimicrobiia bacterium]
MAFARLRPGQASSDLIKKSEQWWNDGGRPPGLRTIAGYGCLGTGPNVFVFETDDHEDLRKQVHFWSEFDFEIHPAVELLEEWRRQGMHVE